MIASQQIKQLIGEIEYLQVQLQETNEMLVQREQELEGLREQAGLARELQSRIDGQIDELEGMQNRIGKEQQILAGALERENELQDELMTALKLKFHYTDLHQEYTYSQAQLNELLEQLADLQQKNHALEKIANKVGELQSELANTVSERNDLLVKLTVLKDLSRGPGLIS